MMFAHIHSTKEKLYGLFNLHVQLDFTIGGRKKGAAKEIIINAASYFQILYTLLREALQRGELKESKAAYDQARVIGEIHRGLTYSWLLSECRYSLTDIVKIVLKTYIDSISA